MGRCACEDWQIGLHMAKTAPPEGQVLKQTTYSETIPRGVQESSARDKMNIWEYIDDLKPEEHGKHMGYVYRWEKDGNVSVAGKLSTPFDEFTLKENFGGGSFRILLKNGAQICKRIERVVIEGKSKVQDDGGMVAMSAVAPMPNGELGLLARILDQQTQMFERLFAQNNSRPMVDEAYRGALQLQADALRTGVSTVRELNPAGPAAGADPFKDKLLDILLTRAFAAPSSPLDSIKSIGEMMSVIKTLVPSAEPAHTSVGIEIARGAMAALPQIAQAITAYSGAVMRPPMPQPGRTIDVTQPQPLRANADDARRNVTPMPASTSAALPAATAADVANAAAQEQPAGEVNQVTPNVEWIEAKVVDLINHPQLSPEQAASDAASFLQTAAPDVLAQMSSEFNLRWVFSNRPIMMRVKDPVKKEAFIVAFLALLNGGGAVAEPVATVPAQPDDGLLFKPEPPSEIPPAS